MTMLDGLKPVFLEALHFADERTRAALVEKWNLECQAVYEYKKQLIAEEHYKAAHNKSEWISVEERLPEESGKYLVSTLKGNVYQTKFYEYPETKGGHWGQKDKGRSITHWMPLPEAPKGGE